MQLNDALTWAQNKITGGHVLSIAGAIGKGAGSYLIVHSKKNSQEHYLTESEMIGWVFLVISIPVEIAGLLKWGINGTRVKSIKEVLKSTELKTGLLNYHGINIYSDSQVTLIPCLSVIIHF